MLPTRNSRRITTNSLAAVGFLTLARCPSPKELQTSSCFGPVAVPVFGGKLSKLQTLVMWMLWTSFWPCLISLNDCKPGLDQFDTDISNQGLPELLSCFHFRFPKLKAWTESTDLLILDSYDIVRWRLGSMRVLTLRHVRQ